MISCMLLVIGLFIAPGQDRKPARLLTDPEANEIREISRNLIHSLESLQEDLSSARTPRRDLYRQADTLLGAMDEFLGTVGRGASRADLKKQFGAFDSKLHAFLKEIALLGPEFEIIHRAADRIGSADDHLHYVLSLNDDNPGERHQLLLRQSQAFAAACSQLERAAQLDLGTEQGSGVVLKDLKQLAEAAEQFRRKIAGKLPSSYEGLDQDFAPVNQAWDRVTKRFHQLKPGQSVFLFHQAGRVNRLHERLFNILGIKGERPTLLLKT